MTCMDLGQHNGCHLPERVDMFHASRMLTLGMWFAPEKSQEKPSVGRKWLKDHPHGENRHTYGRQ